MHTFLVREFVDILLLYLTIMVNASLQQGRLPISQIHAVVDATDQEAGARRVRPGQFPTCLQSDFYVEGRGACGRRAAE